MKSFSLVAMVSVTAGLCIAGCGQQHHECGANHAHGTSMHVHPADPSDPSNPPAPAATTTLTRIDPHTDIGSNGRPLITFGEHDYHAELSVASSTVTVLLFDRSGNQPLPLAQDRIQLNLVVDKQPRQIELLAQAQVNDPPGASSRFVGRDSIFEDLAELSGRISLIIQGKPYTGAVSRRELGVQRL